MLHKTDIELNQCKSIKYAKQEISSKNNGILAREVEHA